MNGYTRISLRHLDLSDNFFDLVQAALGENIKQGNKTQSIQSPKNSQEESEKEHRLQTKWSDQRILIPILFNFFHGIELFLKGIKYLDNDPAKGNNINPKHNLSGLLNEFKNNFPEKKPIIEVLDYYIFPPKEFKILWDFYNDNKIANSDEFVSVFKYPSNITFNKQYIFKGLRRNGKKAIEFFERIISDIDKLREGKKNF